MKVWILGVALAGLLTSGVVSAQTTQGAAPVGTPPTTGTVGGNAAAASGNTNQAVATTKANAPMPARGSNSFTKGEAKRRIEKNGFANVSDLAKDNHGVWRGQAQKDGSAAHVWLDYKGNVGIVQ